MNILSLISSIVKSLQEQLGYSLLISVFFMFFFLYAREYGLKQAIGKWINQFLHDKDFRHMFFFITYTIMILLETVLIRKSWDNPLENIMGGWWTYDKNGEPVYTDAILNVMLFIPFSTLLLWTCHTRWKLQKLWLLNVIWRGLWISFAFSLSIELCQVIFKVGTFQIADLVYNSLGGLLGTMLGAVIVAVDKRWEWSKVSK
ncbi:MAG: VanZ family protein [Eubacteriales bacterium]